MIRIPAVAKAVVAALFGVLEVLVQVFADDTLDLTTESNVLVTAVVAALGVLGVYAVPNQEP